MAEAWEFLLRFLHVLAGTSWLAFDAYLAVVHLPLLRRVDFPGRAEQVLAAGRRAGAFTGGLGFATIILGLLLALEEFGTMNVFSWGSRGGSEGGLVAAGAGLALGALVLWYMRRAPLRRLERIRRLDDDRRMRVDADSAHRRLSLLVGVEATALLIVLGLMISAGLGGF